MTPGRRDLGWFVAGFLSAVAIALFAWLMRPSAPSGASAGGGATAGDSAVAGAALAGGSSVGGGDAGSGAADVAAHAAAPDAGAAANAGSMGEMLARLEARLGSQGGSDADWELLAQTYDFMGRAADATSARSHHVPGTPAARSAQGAAPSAAAGSAQLDGVVDLADALKSKVSAGLTLFVVAKAVGAPGPPVAVMRTSTSQWPLHFRLDDSSAMVPGRNLSSAGAVTVQARISRGGMATPQPGDLQSGVITVNPRDRKSLQLLINQEIGPGQ